MEIAQVAQTKSPRRTLDIRFGLFLAVVCLYFATYASLLFLARSPHSVSVKSTAVDADRRMHDQGA